MYGEDKEAFLGRFEGCVLARLALGREEGCDFERVERL